MDGNFHLLRTTGEVLQHRLLEARVWVDKPGLVRELAFVTGSQVMLMLVVQLWEAVALETEETGGEMSACSTKLQFLPPRS